MELYDSVATSLGFSETPEPELREIAPDEAPSILLDPERTFRDFGQIEFTSLSETVSSAIKYYKEFGTDGEFTHLKAPK